MSVLARIEVEQDVPRGGRANTFFNGLLVSSYFATHLARRYPAIMDEQPPLSIRFKRYLKQLAVRLLIYLAAYVVIASLTIGPMFWYWFGAVHVDGSTWIAKFYAPLLWLCDHVGWLSYLVNSYINWWIL